MPYDIRTAALDASQLSRVKRAAVRVRVYGEEATVEAWDGTRCNLLIARADDAYGMRAIEVALRRQMPVIALGEPLYDIPLKPLPGDVTAEVLALVATQRLRQQDSPLPSTVDCTKDCPSALCRLSRAPLRGQPIDARRGGRTLLFRPKRGRVYAASHADFLVGIDHFFAHDWEMRAGNADADYQEYVSSSIESFLLRSAYRGKHQLPDFPEGRYCLKAWPDLGAMPSLVSALRISQRLVNGSVTPSELTQCKSGGIKQSSVNACLWALAAADMLLEVAPVDNMQGKGLDHTTTQVEPRKQRIGSGLWARVAKRFGLATD